jgi:ubiquinone/menaquinone biosynthesis C-methylase UbiE
MEQCTCTNECSSVAKCDIFDFMAKHVGMTVIHPGGFAATNKLIASLNIRPGSNVIDIACGKGTTAVLLAEKYGCSVTAVDIDAGLVEDGKRLARKRGLENKITFCVGDALNLPFAGDEFDAAVSQAMLVLVDDKVKAIQEANRVIRKGGRAGWLELSWRKEPSEEFIEKVSTVICAYCMTNVSTFDGWKRIFEEAGIKDLNVIPLDFNPGSGGMMGMFKDEGFFRSLAMMMRIMKNKEIKDRMTVLNKFFKENSDIFGCGIYYFTK